MCKGGIYAVSADDLYRVTIESDALRTIIEHSNRAGMNETGGILIGHINGTGQAIISEVTGKPRGSMFGRFTFVRKTAGLASLLRTRWLDKRYYLGEWHSHPGAEPNPSERDRQSMRTISSDEGYCCPEPILLILGHRAGRPAITLTVFPRDCDDVCLTRGIFVAPKDSAQQ
ncbi:Mov34/MPN/PAD-1 family protein [Brucella anthropi]|uniref:Mov34/MPN/PAD-1 family protein n=1 Tax=Brucella anthropi TaxID=529 RepID=UPI000287BF02